MLETVYYQGIKALIDRIVETQRPNIELGAQTIAASLIQGGVLHVFGSGHSAMVGKEITQRAGGLVPVNLIPDPSEGLAERVEGYGKVLLDAYARKYGLNPGEVIIVVSTSGRNPVPIEIAMEAKARGLFTIGIVSLEYARQSRSRHRSGKRLFEVVDLVLDNCVPPGDAIVEMKELGQKSGASSTIAGALLVNMLMLRVIEEICRRGGTPPILKSQNLEGADEHNQKLLAAYRGRLNL
ncbi:MAG: sugar isomerase domain-containing protein [Desulfotomaculales bacterium]